MFFIFILSKVYKFNKMGIIRLIHQSVIKDEDAMSFFWAFIARNHVGENNLRQYSF